MYNPVSTYRIQFHKGFNLIDFEQIIPYLENLGIKTVYASPIFSAVPGSVHGYDGINPLQINPEIGTIEQLRSISKKLKEKGIGWLQDIVPNHMAYHHQNEWLMDVLENGPLSPYKCFFDSSLTDDLLFSGAIMVPFLGTDLVDAINNNELTIGLIHNKPVFKYAGQVWPLKPASYQNIGDINAINKEQLLQIANGQYYRLCSYKETDYLINFRRFFTVNSLICLNMQSDEVFNIFHQLIIELVKEDVFQGIRIDHIDGLYDPSKYLSKLRKLLGDETYIVVEKILEKGEKMPVWPIQGNTGYDFLALVNNLLTSKANKHKFTSFYKSLTHSSTPVAQQILDKKTYTLHHQMAGELDNLTDLFFRSAIVKSGEIVRDEIKRAIALFLINCPDYRFYGNTFPLHKEEKEQIGNILSAIKSSNKKLAAAIELLKTAFFNSTENENALHFYMRCMQFSGPLMAKGVEDTLMYTYNRFIGHNEVGDAPDAFSIDKADFHKKMRDRQKLWPLSMNATATHDTKRGEDVRARLNVLPDVADEWLEAVHSWQQMNQNIKQIGAPDANDEYFIYQTLMGAYPMPGEDDSDFGERLQEYLQKTMREAKLHSNWAVPDEKYEKAVLQFAHVLLDKRKPFWKTFKALHGKIAQYGVINSLSQIILKLTSPGIPDIYQGCEHWDLSLVDPDNRRPVDFNYHQNLFTTKSSLKTLWDNKFNGQIKIWLTQLLLQERRVNSQLFAKGKYIPLNVKGKYKNHVFAFARSYKRTWYIIVIPLNLAGVSINDWGDTRIIIPKKAPEKFENLILKTKGKQQQYLLVKDLFKTVPFALLKLEYPDSSRSSGILMHITSLPSKFGIGDFGAGARAFADLLHLAHQKYWQLLPLSPVDKSSQYSPYSSYSSMAGNVLLLSPELLFNDGLVNVEEYFLPASNKVDYKEANAVKQKIFIKAWMNFKNNKSELFHVEFTAFCKNEAFWLDDYALYIALKQEHKNAPWYQWPDDFKFREEAALNNFIKNNTDALDKEKWLQYQFAKQWRDFKRYCNQRSIQLFGDLPFYVSHDSVDVWSHPELFSLDENGSITQVAGVPPDYFSSDGQLWGMPVFCWDKLKEQNYDWWIQRIQKNLERFDLLRLDHFRAFSSYWTVPAGETTAINGKWERGPGAHFFNALKNEFGELPFVAEDLGDIDEKVYKLRDRFKLPGMRVLQFAFGPDAAASPHLPQNYIINTIAYTGTHDNNTIKGWYSQEADKKTLKRLSNYAGLHVNEKNINDVFIRMAMASVAKIVIIPMQDILGLDEKSRINVPSETDGNWVWRCSLSALKLKRLKRLREWTKTYNRI
jgi:malto-oligosyltrehalose synthase/4-alpha-glucanotransferase